MAETRSTSLVPATHPALPGHFPGRPIVPGVLLLDCVLDAVRSSLGATDKPLRLIDMPVVKFLRRLRPDEAFDIVCAREGDSFRFRCLIGVELVAEGLLSFAETTAHL